MTSTRTGQIGRVTRFAGSSNRNVPVTPLQHQPRIVIKDSPAARHRRLRCFPYNSQGDCIMPSCTWAWAIAVLLLLPSAPAQTINGAGATFPYPLYGQWFDVFQSAHRGVEINYRPVGSGSGHSPTAGWRGRFRRLRHAPHGRAVGASYRQTENHGPAFSHGPGRRRSGL